jgi:hypothetical protein
MKKKLLSLPRLKLKQDLINAITQTGPYPDFVDNILDRKLKELKKKKKEKEHKDHGSSADDDFDLGR